MTLTPGLLGYTNRLLTGALTAGSAAAGLPVTNLQNDQGSPAAAWQTASGVKTKEAGAWFLCDAGSDVTWRAFLLARTNLTSAAQVRWRVGGYAALFEAVPSVDLDFVGASPSSLASWTWTRAGAGNGDATYFDASATLQASAANTPRRNYDPVTQTLEGVLIEPQRTNGLPNPRGEGFSLGVTPPTGWTAIGFNGVTAGFVATATVGGISYVAVRIQGTATGGAGLGGIFPCPGSPSWPAASGGDFWSLSWFHRIETLAAGTMNKASLFLYQYDSGGTAIAQPETLVTAPSGAALSAQRAKAERVACVTGTAHLTMGIGYWFNDGPVDVTVWVALPQMEKGEFVTMPILPPAGTPGATTRNGDSGFVSLAANLLDNGGTLFAETKSSGSTATLSDTGGILVSSSGGADVVNLRGVGGSVSYLDAIATKASVVQFDSGNLPISFGETQRVAAAWATNSVDIAGDGISLGTYTSSANPIVTILKIYSGERRVHVRKIKVFNSRLNIGQVNSISRTGSPVDLSLLGYDSGMIPAGVAAGYMQTANIAPAEVTGRYCLLEAWDAGNPDGFLSVPLAYAGPAWEPAYNFGWATAFAIDATQVVTQTRGGQEYPNLLFEQRRHDVAFDAIKSAEVWPLAMEAWRIGRRGGNLLFIPNPASDDLQREAIFGRIAQLADVGYSQGTLDFRTWRFRITERL